MLAGIEADAAALAERARLFQEELERADAASPDTYSTVDLPAHTSRKRFNKVAASIPGATVEGSTRDRMVTVSRHAWHAFRRRPTLARTILDASAEASRSSDDAQAEEMLAAVGLRATSGGRR